jgi:hypothetical protein
MDYKEKEPTTKYKRGGVKSMSLVQKDVKIIEENNAINQRPSLKTETLHKNFGKIPK